MDTVVEAKDRVSKYFAFNSGELRALLITILVYGLIVSFSFDLPELSMLTWFGYLLPSILIAALAILVHVAVVRIFSLRRGYRAEFRMNFYAMAVTLVISIISRGQLFFIVPGITIFHMLEGLRIGKFRYGINWWEVRWPVFWASVANLVIALIFRLISNVGVFSANPLIEKMILVNLSVALFAMLPLPDFEGLYIFFSSPLVYSFTFSIVVGACIAIFFNIGFWLSLFVSLLIGGVGWIIYLLGVELK
jgi:hypothetical protein